MTSIIKVDQIQNAAGGTPTAADLGLNVSGSVLDHQFMRYGTKITLSGAGLVDSGLTLTITPKSVSSKFIINYNIFLYCPTISGWSAAWARILRDGTQIQADDYTLGRGGDYNSSGHMRNSSNTYVDEPNTTSAITYKVQVSAYTGTIYVHQGDQKGFLSITEIAG